jgi:choline dehydrogenase-like flavoprotein
VILDVFKWEDHRPCDPQAVDWDVVVVGTGMGGAFLGWSLARRGAKVLFLERGEPVSPFNRPAAGGSLKRLFDPRAGEADLALMGRWSRPVSLDHDGRRRDFHLPMGNGPGGSTAIYGATLERFRREDFAGTDGEGVEPAPLPNRWPIAYDDFLPYYREAERILRVRGSPDPTDADDDSDLLPAPPMSDRDRHLFERFANAGLEPHRMHMGVDYKPGCVECLGRLCPRDCKSESANRALRPALTAHGAKLLTGFTVDRLGVCGGRVTEVTGRCGDHELTVKGRTVVLAAGALATPLILLGSRSEAWPQGLGNDCGLVGRGLMFHVLQIFALWPRHERCAAGPAKTISSRIMNQVGGDRLGGLQSFAQSVSVSQVSEFLVGTAERALGFGGPFMKLLAHAAALVGARLFAGAALFATLTEDYAYPENRLTPDPASPSGFRISYRQTQELARRSARMRRYMRDRLADLRLVWLTLPGNLNFGHPSGTCRFGSDPKTSVLDPQNKVRGMENLYVVDASFFPSSAATNPSLTIAANALRVADVIAGCRDVSGGSWEAQPAEAAAA